MENGENSDIKFFNPYRWAVDLRYRITAPHISVVWLTDTVLAGMGIQYLIISTIFFILNTNRESYQESNQKLASNQESDQKLARK